MRGGGAMTGPSSMLAGRMLSQVSLWGTRATQVLSMAKNKGHYEVKWSSFS